MRGCKVLIRAQAQKSRSQFLPDVYSPPVPGPCCHRKPKQKTENRCTPAFTRGPHSFPHITWASSFSEGENRKLSLAPLASGSTDIHLNYETQPYFQQKQGSDIQRGSRAFESNFQNLKAFKDPRALYETKRYGETWWTEVPPLNSPISIKEYVSLWNSQLIYGPSLIDIWLL